jgi:GDPmannose 4,6-dehydratase
VKPGDIIVRVDPRYFRPAEVQTLLGDPTKARDRLGWVPKVTARQLCSEMVAADLAIAKQHALLASYGYPVSVSTGI